MHIFSKLTFPHQMGEVGDVNDFAFAAASVIVFALFALAALVVVVVVEQIVVLVWAFSLVRFPLESSADLIEIVSPLHF